jgi:hypothetical protein
MSVGKTLLLIGARIVGSTTFFAVVAIVLAYQLGLNTGHKQGVRDVGRIIMELRGEGALPEPWHSGGI